jgi:hypothetical protein
LSNQTVNAGINYGNRNASSTYTNEQIARSYGIAVASSITVALCLKQLLSPFTRGMTGSKAIGGNAVVALTASAAAGYLNALSMRQTEMVVGIDVMDPADPDTPIGIKSQAAAKTAVFSTANSRGILCLPLIFPPAVFYGLERMGMYPKRFGLSVAVQLSAIFVELYLAVPFAIAMYPQYATIGADKLEPEIQAWKNKSGKQIDYFMYNKGL